MTKEKLIAIVTKIRNVIASNNGSGINWEGHNYVKDFPNECCDITCEILKKFLKDEYNIALKIKRSKLYDSHKNTEREHLFLEGEDFIIDITAEQFNNRNDLPIFP